MADSNFRKSAIKIFSKLVSEDVIRRKFKQNACNLCRVEFHDEKAAWKHYYGNLHGDRMKSLPRMERAPEFWVMILKSLEAFDPKLISKTELIDFMVDRFDVRENFSMACINDKVDTNMEEMIIHFQTVKKTGNKLGLKQRGRQELQNIAGRRFLEQENRYPVRAERSTNGRKRSGDERNQEQGYKRKRHEDEIIRERSSSSRESSRKVHKQRSSAATEEQKFSKKYARKTPSPCSVQYPNLLQEQHQQLLTPQQQQNLQVPQQLAPTRPIIILPPNLNLSSLPTNLLSSLGPALSQMLTPQQLQSHSLRFPYSQFSNQQVQHQQHIQATIPSNTPSQIQPSSPPTATTSTSPTTKPVSPRSHYKMFLQQQHLMEEPQSARI